MGILSQLNSPVIFLICGSIVLVVALMMGPIPNPHTPIALSYNE